MSVFGQRARAGAVGPAEHAAPHEHGDVAGGAAAVVGELLGAAQGNVRFAAALAGSA